MDNATQSTFWIDSSFGARPVLGILLRFIVLKYFSQYYSFCTVGHDFLENVSIGKIQLTVDEGSLEENLQRAIDNGCQAFLVDEPGIVQVLDLYMPVHDLSEQRSLDKRLILLVTERNQQEVFNRVVTHEALREIINVLIVVYDDDRRAACCYTTEVKYFGAHEPFNITLRQLPINWSDWERGMFFPDKSTDLDGYVLRMATCNYLPFTGWWRVDPGLGNAFDSVTGERSILLDGTELLLVVSFCERRNCTILALPDDENEWGDVYPNGTGIGILGSVAERRTDIALAAIFLWNKPYSFIAYTASISRSGVTVLVPKPRMLPFWRTPFLSFSWPLWTAVIMTFVVGSGVAWTAGKIRYRLLRVISGQEMPTSEQLPLSEVVLMMVGFFVAQSSPVRSDLWSCVFLFASLLLAGFMVSNLYSGGLASVMTVPQYEKSIDTVVDFAANGMWWYGPTPYCTEEILNATEPHLKQILTTFKVATLEETQRLTRAGDSAFIIEQAQHGNFAPSNFLDRDTSTMFQALRDDIYFQNCAALMTKTNPLREVLNAYILQVQQSGILYHWGTTVAIRYLPTDVFRNIEQARLHRHADGVIVTLRVDHFLGAFCILGFGLLCATVAFVGELWGAEIVRRFA
ncbi:glutamate receptor ionotropic, delta-1-like [Anopheles ziemanni]|uniref:glutamate receptor ionotropic, delta-1-like n=1 Tax=Anopheles coustani TaxID=139045 RepID=UPI00265AFDCC|nr:glutamate receptor ionotropic, delta-1-like [Anopheles coustani]XP_058169670.1 glutamate receptor ionotropic, delta-1-like [Anopheles ziemanni]